MTKKLLEIMKVSESLWYIWKYSSEEQFKEYAKDLVGELATLVRELQEDIKA